MYLLLLRILQRTFFSLRTSQLNRTNFQNRRKRKLTDVARLTENDLRFKSFFVIIRLYIFAVGTKKEKKSKLGIIFLFTYFSFFPFSFFN